MWPQTAFIILVGVMVIASVAVASGSARWRFETRQINAQLNSSRSHFEQPAFDPEELGDLPAPVQRYFRAVLTDGQPIIDGVRMTHTGMFNLSETGQNWKPFASTQRVVTRRPGFLWDARIAVTPGISVRVHDAYAAGTGTLHASVFGLFSVMEARDAPGVAEGELMRFFAECAWYPTALLPGQGVRWEALDDRRATATMRDGNLTLSMQFSFGTNDLIESVRTERRGHVVGGKVIPTPWEGRWSNYQRHDGVLIPFDGEVAWLLQEGARPYWRGRVQSIHYEFAD